MPKNQATSFLFNCIFHGGTMKFKKQTFGIIFIFAYQLLIAKEISITSWNLQTFFDGNTTGTEYSEFKKNKNWNVDFYEARLNKLSDAIKLIESNIFVFQEIENKDFFYDVYNKISDLSWNHKKKFKYAAFSKKQGDAIGCGIMSQYPITKIKNHTLDIRTENEKQPSMRSILEVEIKVDDVSMKIFVNHWKSKSGGAEKSEKWRIWQESQLFTLLDKNKTEKIIVCGDFNKDIQEFNLTNNKVNLFKHKKYFCSVSKQVCSPWIVSENDYVCPGSYYYNDEWERIDHFFVNENVNVISFEPLINELWCDENGIPNPYRVYTHKGVSDHLPINCKIDI